MPNAFLDEYMQRKQALAAEQASDPTLLLHAMNRNLGYIADSMGALAVDDSTDNSLDSVDKNTSSTADNTKGILGVLSRLALTMGARNTGATASPTRTASPQAALPRLSSMAQNYKDQLTPVFKKFIGTEKPLEDKLSDMYDLQEHNAIRLNTINTQILKTLKHIDAGIAHMSGFGGGDLIEDAIDLMGNGGKGRGGRFGRMTRRLRGSGRGLLGNVRGRLAGALESGVGRLGQIRSAVTSPFTRAAEAGKSVLGKVLNPGQIVSNTIKRITPEWLPGLAEKSTGLASRVGGAISKVGSTVLGTGKTLAGGAANLIGDAGSSLGRVGGRAINAVGEGAGMAARAGGSILRGGAKFLGPLAGLVTAGFAAKDVYDIAGNKQLDARQKATGIGGAVGNGGGALAGGAAGASLGAAIGSVVPGIGTAIGAVAGGIIGSIAGSKIGQTVGEKMGGIYNDDVKPFFTKTVLPGFSKAWDGGVNMFKTVWGDGTAALGTMWTSFSDGWKKSFGAIADQYGTLSKNFKDYMGQAGDYYDQFKQYASDQIQGTKQLVQDSLGKAWTATKQGASTAYTAVKTGATAAVNTVSNAASTVGNVASNAYTGAKNLGSKLVGSINDMLYSQTQDAIDQHVKYQMGGKNTAQGAIDCSGWVSQINRNMIDGINKQAGDQVFDPKTKKLFQTSADGIIKGISKQTGKLLTNEDLKDPKNLKAGMLIGEQTGRLGKGNYDHVVQLVKDPKTGQMMVSESRGGKGVTLSPADKWIAQNDKKGRVMGAVDPTDLANDPKKARSMLDATQAGPTPIKAKADEVAAVKDSVKQAVDDSKTAATVNAGRPAPTPSKTIAETNKQTSNQQGPSKANMPSLSSMPLRIDSNGLLFVNMGLNF